MQHARRDVGAEPVAVLQVSAIKLPLAAIGAFAPGFLAGVRALPFRPAKGGKPLIHQLALSRPTGKRIRRQLRATGGAAQQVHHQGGGVIARVANHVLHGSPQLRALQQQIPRQPLLNGHGIGQFHHTGGVALLITAVRSAANRQRPHIFGLQACGQIDGGGVVQQPGDAQLLLQAGPRGL